MPEYRRYGAPLPDELVGHALRDLCISIPDAPEYRQAFWGQLWELGEARFWEKTTPDDNRSEIAAQVWRDILSVVQSAYDAGAGCEKTDECQTYPNTANFIRYFPNDPRYNPDFIGDGYNNPAWYFATPASNALLGTQFGDIVTSIDRFPPGSLPTILPASGLPRIRVAVNGSGTVRLFFRNMIAGSVFQITIDDNPLTAFFVDVNRDLISVPPETVDALSVDVNIATSGPHVVDAIVVSLVNDQIPFLNHGGGLVRVELCGDLSPVVQEIPDLAIINYPVGIFVKVADDDPLPAGLLRCDGSTFLREDYPDLYAYYEAVSSGLIIDADSAETPSFANETFTVPGFGAIPAYWCIVAATPAIETIVS